MQCHYDCLLVMHINSRSTVYDNLVITKQSVTYDVIGKSRFMVDHGDKDIDTMSCDRWPKTLAGLLAFLPCAPSTFGSAPHPSGASSHHLTQREKKAWRRCDRAGQWAEDDYTQCPYASEVTRVLHELTQVGQQFTPQISPLTQESQARNSHLTSTLLSETSISGLFSLAETKRDKGGG